MDFIEIVEERNSVKHRIKSLAKIQRISGPDTVWKYLQKNMPDYQRELYDWTWIVAGNLTLLTKAQVEQLKLKKVLLGPNIHFENPHIASIVRSLNHRKIVAPSEWVANYFESSGIETRKKIAVWASTVDPDDWSPLNKSRSTVLIYLKDFSKQELLEEITQYLSLGGVKFHVLNYGSYSKRDFRKFLNRSSCAIWIGGTESQGLALLESWFMDVPTLVLENSVFTSSDGFCFPASSAPYLDNKCGRFFSMYDHIPTQISTFLSELHGYNPRSWALENFSHKNVLKNLLSALASSSAT
jgi:hypothetical protein